MHLSALTTFCSAQHSHSLLPRNSNCVCLPLFNFSPTSPSQKKTQAKKQDGNDYKRSSLLDMTRGVLRAINTAYKQLEIDGKSAPAQLSLNTDTVLFTAADSTCRQLTAAGKGDVTQQPSFKPAELQALITTVKSLPASSWRHTFRKYAWLGIHWGGRESEYHMIDHRCVCVCVCVQVCARCLCR